MHGAHASKNVLKGTEHPNYKYGLDTNEANAERKKKFAELREITTNLGVKLGG